MLLRRGVGVLVLVAVATLAAAGSIPRADSAAITAFVRVNQVGYPSGASKRAYLMSSVDATGAAFTVRSSSGAVVFSGQAGGNLGSWSNAYSFVHPLDFDALGTAGTYT